VSFRNLTISRHATDQLRVTSARSDRIMWFLNGVSSHASMQSGSEGNGCCRGHCLQVRYGNVCPESPAKGRFPALNPAWSPSVDSVGNNPAGATAEAAKPIATVGAPAPDVALTVALTANQATHSKKSPPGEPSPAGPPLKCPTRSHRWRAQVPDVAPTPARPPHQAAQSKQYTTGRTPAPGLPAQAASPAVVRWFEIVDQMVWRGAIWIAHGDQVGNLPAECTWRRLERSARTSPFHRKYLRRRPVSACLCSPPELMNVVSGKPP